MNVGEMTIALITLGEMAVEKMTGKNE